MNKLHLSPDSVERSQEVAIEKPKSTLAQVWSVVSNKSARAVEKVASGGTMIVGSGVLLSGCTMTGVSWLDTGLTVVGGLVGSALLLRMHLKHNGSNERSLVQNVFTGDLREQEAGLKVRAPWEIPVFPDSAMTFRQKIGPWLTGDWSVDVTDFPVPTPVNGGGQTFKDKMEIGSGQDRAEVGIDWTTRVGYAPGGLPLLYRNLGFSEGEIKRVVEEGAGDAIRSVMGQQPDIKHVFGNLGDITNRVNEMQNGQNVQASLQALREQYGLNVRVVQIKPEENEMVKAARQKLRVAGIEASTAEKEAEITRTNANAEADAIRARDGARVEIQVKLTEGVVGAAKGLDAAAQGIAVAAAVGGISPKDAADLGVAQAQANQGNAIAGAASGVARRLNTSRNSGGSTP